MFEVALVALVVYFLARVTGFWGRTFVQLDAKTEGAELVGKSAPAAEVLRREVIRPSLRAAIALIVAEVLLFAGFGTLLLLWRTPSFSDPHFKERALEVFSNEGTKLLPFAIPALGRFLFDWWRGCAVAASLDWFEVRSSGFGVSRRWHFGSVRASRIERSWAGGKLVIEMQNGRVAFPLWQYPALVEFLKRAAPEGNPLKQLV